jgi:CheY-like chemotaxis protein
MAKVLIVDDDPAILRVLSHIIEEEGLDAFAVPDGVEALGVLGERSIDLAIVDLIMPDMNGNALMRWMRKAYPKAKLVPMSTAEELLANPSEFLAEVSLRKPFTVEDVKTVLRQVLKGGLLEERQ